MNRTSVSLRALFVVTVASSLFALSAGCSSGSAGRNSAIATSPLSLPQSPRSLEAPAQPDSTASVNNARDLANAQPEDVLDFKPAQERDINGGEAQGGQPLTYETLGAALQKLGLTPEDKNPFWAMKVKATTADGAEWTFIIDASLSKDQGVVWINCNLCPIDKNGSPSAESLINLLEANNLLATSNFALSQDHSLFLQEPIPNIGITPQILGASLKSFFTCLKLSEPLFKPFFGNPSGGQGGGGGNPFQ
ncbi:MAG: hypothetical protein ABSB42_08715 [Tepidisphaeraceae bacterium]